MGYLDSAKKKNKKPKSVEEVSIRPQANPDMGFSRSNPTSLPTKRPFGRRSGTK